MRPIPRPVACYHAGRPAGSPEGLGRISWQPMAQAVSPPSVESIALKWGSQASVCGQGSACGAARRRVAAGAGASRREAPLLAVRASVRLAEALCTIRASLRAAAGSLGRAGIVTSSSACYLATDLSHKVKRCACIACLVGESGASALSRMETRGGAWGAAGLDARSLADCRCACAQRGVASLPRPPRITNTTRGLGQ